jgi:hypothetical protein
MRADFPALHSLSDSQIETWILDQFGYISELELKLRGVRVSNFEVGEEVRTFIHPPGYNRASVAPAILDGTQIGMVDLKGNGHAEKTSVYTQLELSRNPRHRWGGNNLLTRAHSDGVASFGEAISEVAKQRAEQAGYDLGYAKGQTVEHYFIIDSGFDILKPHGERIPAGIMGRQPCIQGNNFKGTEAPKLYSDEHGGFQRSITGSTRDFGGHIVLIDDVKVNFDVIPGGNPSNPQSTKSWAFGHDTAKAFRERAAENLYEARSYIYRHIDEMLGPLTARWKKVRSIGPASNEAQFSALMEAYFDHPNQLSERVNLLRKIGRENDPSIYGVLAKYFAEKKSDEVGPKAYYASKFLFELDGPTSERLGRFFTEFVAPGIRSGKINSALVIPTLVGMTLPHDREFFLEFLKGGEFIDKKFAPLFVELTLHHPYLRDPEALKIIEKNALRSPYLDLVDHGMLDTDYLRQLFKPNPHNSDAVKRILQRFECTDSLKAPILVNVLPSTL